MSHIFRGSRRGGHGLAVGIHREPRHLTALGLVDTTGQHRLAHLPGDTGQVLEHRRVDVGWHHHLYRNPVDGRLTRPPDHHVPVGRLHGSPSCWKQGFTRPWDGPCSD